MRRRFVQINGELIEVGPGYRAPLKTNTDAVLWNDRSYQDMNDPRFASRKAHREYMRRKGLATVDDFSQQFKRDEQRRAEFYRGVDHSRRSDIERALEKRK